MSQATKLMKLDFSVDEIPWEGGRVFYKWWLDLAERKGIPSRKDFDPMEFARFLPNVMLTDVTGDPYNFNIRLAGTKISENLGERVEGKEIRELRSGEAMYERFSMQASNKKPYYATDLPLLWAHKDFSTYDVLMLPLSDDGVTVNKLLSHLNFNI